MRNRLFFCPFGYQGATRLLFKEALRSASGSPAYSFLTYIAPTPRKVRAAQLDFMELAGKPALIPPTFATLNQFAGNAYARNGRLLPLDARLRTLLLSRLLPEFGLQRSSLGYAQAVGDFIKLIWEYRPDLTPEALEAQVAAIMAEFDRPRANVLRAIKIMRRYQELLAAKGWTDDQGALAALADEAGHPSPLLPAGSSLILDGFYDLTRLQEGLVARLLREAEVVHALTYVSPAGAEGPASVSEFSDFLRSHAKFDVVHPDPPRPPRSSPRLFCFTSREEEVEGIARDLKLRLREDTLRTDQAIVVFPSFPPYTPIVNRTFEKFGIPCTIFPERMLASSPPIVAALELLNAVENNFPRIPFVACLTSPYFPRISDACRSSVNRFSIRAEVLKDPIAWQHLERRLLNDDEIELGKNDKELLARTQKDINLLLELCSRYGTSGLEPGSLTGHAKRLKALLDELSFARILDLEETEDAELRQDRRLLYGLLDSLIAFEADFGVQDYSLPEFHRMLSHMVRQTPAPPERELKGVLVCNTLETRGLDCRQLYYGGLIEGELPSRFEHDPILPDTVRVKLNLPNLEHHNQWQHLHFLRLINTPENDPFLSYPDTEEDRLLLPSPFLDAEPENPLPADGIFTREEQQRRLGRDRRTTYEDLIQPLALQQEPEVVSRLAQTFGPEVYHSVTALERYCRCPVEFYIEVVLGLESLEEPGFNIKPTDWGTIFHRVLELLYRDGSVPLSEVPDRLRQIIPRVLDEQGLPRFWQRAVNRVLADVQVDFLRHETRLRAEGYEPVRVERRATGAVFPDIRLKARIDRIDRAGDDLRVLDYKTGSGGDVSGPAILERGTHVQLPLYARLVQDANPGQTVSNIGLYNLREMEIRWLAGRKNRLEDLVAAALANVRRVVDAIRRAEFPPRPGDRRSCEKCGYGFLCPSAVHDPPDHLAARPLGRLPT